MFKNFFISILFTLSILISSSYAESDIEENKSNWKVQKIEKKMSLPDDIPFYDENDKKIYIEELEGKTVLIVFWATWCAPCHAEMLELDVLKKDFRKLPIDIIPISQDYQGVSAVKDFYQRNNIRHLAIYHDFKNELFREMRVAGLPTAYILNSDGYIKAIITGSISWHDEKLRELVLSYIEGNHPMPKNSFRDNSLNQAIKKPVQKEPKQEENKEDKPKIEDEKNDTKNDSK